MGNIHEGELRLGDLKYLAASHEEFPSLLLKPGDVLFNRTNSPELVGKTAVYRGQPSPASFASYLLRLRFGHYEPSLFSHYLNSSFGRSWIGSVVSQQVGQANVNSTKLRALELPVPPLAEQRRIVAKLDDLLAKSRRAKAALAAIPPLLERFRQSVLAAAFRGDLTAEWRAKHPDVEPAEALLRRIRAERRAKWEEAELAKLRAKGKAPTDDRWKERYREPEPVDASGLPELPAGWAWAGLDELSLVAGGLTKNDSKRSGGEEVPLVSVAALQLRRVDLSAISSIRLAPEDGDKGELERNDVLIVEGNGSLSHIGRVALWDVDLPKARHQNHLIRVRPILVSPGFLMEWLASPRGRARIIDLATSATGLYTLSISKVERIQVPLPPLDEQVEILRAVREALGAADSVGKLFAASHDDLAQLDAALLAKAFRGELVPQDPNDEPASVLLDRLRAERAAGEGKGKPARRMRRPASDAP
jgi:type I restriction enzyme S subunit